MATDRRAQLTRQMIKDALVAEMAERPDGHVSITGLCQRADVHRSTFYAQYGSIDAVLDDMAQEFAEHIAYIDESKPMSHNLAAFEHFLSYCRDHADRFVVLRRCGKLEQIMIEQARRVYLTSQGDGGPADPKVHEMLVVYSVEGTLTDIDAWLSGSVDLTAEQLSHILLGSVLSLGIVEAALHMEAIGIKHDIP